MFEVCFNTTVRGVLKYHRNDIKDFGDDILDLCLLLNEGDIVSPILLEDCPRKDVLSNAICYKEDKRAEEWFSKNWNNWILNLEALKSGIDEIRVWVDNTAEAQCGLLFIAHLLSHTSTKIYLAYYNHGNEIRGLGEADDKLLNDLINSERILTHQEILDLSSKWEKLQQENAPLRIIENGEIKSCQLSINI